MGWTMNDLRSQNRTLAPVREIGPATGEIVNNPTGRRSGPAPNPLFESSRPAERTTNRKAVNPAEKDPAPSEGPAVVVGDTEVRADEQPGAAAESLTFPVSRHVDAMAVSARHERRRPTESTAKPAAFAAGGLAGDDPDAVHAASGGDDGARGKRRRRDLSAPSDGPETRPTKRREVVEDEEPEVEEEKFSWSFKLEDGAEQPEELQAKSPLLSRAFRSSVG